MFTKRVLATFSIVFLLFLLVGCSVSHQTDSVKDKSHSENSTGEVTPKSSQNHTFPIKVTDATGTAITLKRQPHRIVSLIPSNTEITYALGLGNDVVGVTDNDNYPSDVKNKEKVGGYQLNIEKIISLKPDLVLAQSLNQKDAINQLRQAGITVAVIKNPSSFAGVYKSIKMIGELTGTSEKANQIINKMQQQIDAIKQKLSNHPNLKKKKVWVEISAPPNIYTTGKGTFMNQMLSFIGAINAAGQLSGYPKLSEEQAVKYNPDVIILTYGGKKAVQSVLNRQAWRNVSAIKNKQVFTIDTNLVSRPGPRLVKGVEQLAKIVYPSVFN